MNDPSVTSQFSQALPFLLVAMVAVGMALAFWLADRRSPTSRALALGLSNMGLSLLLSQWFVLGPNGPSPHSGWTAIPEGITIIAFSEWMLRVRRTVPSGNLNVRGGDLLLRIGQLGGLAYAMAALLWPQTRAADFIGAGTQGFAVLARPGFWLFATPILLTMFTGLASTLLLINRKPDLIEVLRMGAFIVAVPFFVLGFVVPQTAAAISVMCGLVILLIGGVQYHVLQGQRGEFLGRFLSPQVAKLVNQKGLSAAMQQAHLELSVVCCDLRGFTAFAQVTPSQQVIAVLADYYEVVGQVVSEYGGTIKDYAGDGILILVGAPLAIDEHARVALEISRKVRDVGTQLTRRWSTPRARLGIGLGVASGFVTVGVIGSASRLEYTAVGPAVNLASRLCEEAEDQEILICPRTAECAPSTALKSRSARAIRGFGELSKIYAMPQH